MAGAGRRVRWAASTAINILAPAVVHRLRLRWCAALSPPVPPSPHSCSCSPPSAHIAPALILTPCPAALNAQSPLPHSPCMLPLSRPRLAATSFRGGRAFAASASSTAASVGARPPSLQLDRPQFWPDCAAAAVHEKGSRNALIHYALLLLLHHVSMVPTMPWRPESDAARDLVLVLRASMHKA